jgi:RimJ/RimL family protein N-acetyltransferase
LDNKNVSRFTSDRVPFPYINEDANKFFEYVKNPEGHIYLAIELNKELIGGLGIHPQELNLNRNVEIGYWIGEEYWGKGYTFFAVQLALKIAFENTNINKIIARTIEGNIASEKILAKSGFQQEGLLRKNVFKRAAFLDEKYWGLLRSEYSSSL